MSEIHNLIELLSKNLENNLVPLNWFEWGMIYIIPFIQVLVVIGGAIGAIWKYYSVKNREINEKILNEVYAPLYQYFVVQEFYCFLNGIDRDYENHPILEVSSKETKTNLIDGSEQISEAIVLDLNRKSFFNVLKSVNMGLASKELFTLLNMYRVAVYIEESVSSEKEEYINATIMKVDLEKALRKEVVKGYNSYHNKLKLDKVENNNFIKVEEDIIKFNYVFDEYEREKLKQSRLQSKQF